MRGAVDSMENAEIVVDSRGPEDHTTAHGLDGQVSTLACEIQGIPMRSHVHTFARAKRVVIVQVYSYTKVFDVETAALVTDSLRIDA
jgi:hypothetical protein